MKILVIEDDPKIGSFLEKGLAAAGHQVDLVRDGNEALHLASTRNYDVAVVDVMLPGRDGLSLVEELRRRRIQIPALFLSARRSVDDRIRGLKAGGDDYMTKPFSFSEVLARVEALVRRSNHTPQTTTLRFEDLELDLLARKARRGGKEIDLNPKEFALLEYLMRHPGRIISKTAILEHVYGYDFDPQTNVVDVLVCRLRAKVDRDFERKLIHTVRGAGYVLRS